MGGPRLRIDQEATGLNLEIQGFNASHDFVVVDLDEDYDVILGMPFCEKYDPRPHWREKILRFPAKTSPSGEELHLLDSEVYPEEGGDEFFGRRELRRLMKKQSTKLHLFRLEGISRGCLRKHLQGGEVDPRVRAVLEKHYDRFPDELPGLPSHRPIECEIKLEAGHTPPARAPYRLSFGQLDELRKQLDSYLEKGHIRPSSSPYAAPVLFVQKADGTQRMCIDFTGLNKITIKDKFPLPHPEDLLNRLHGAKIFSSLDLRQYFHQLRIREGDEEKMAFVT
eukprot:Cvel_25006.t1-p1 / transcript=Cvel_25006.t1 / gene=Cvel_25006 / organism=Chromera_velia_CCMP2878 / gene_product=Transposon Ty3-I Gag-Pol polyprotein, putative / transcript_product=Transposon Ty3-I Gag-Pol polyprotein, putative / location=Cvel_scaffold2771:22935-23888(+) / protein_length=280 / sequence_SO=supercontig / SO=protein_coding / is_pseudo=false